MDRPSTSAVVAASVAGLANGATILALYAHGDYPALESTASMTPVVLRGFGLGFVAVFVTLYTRLLSPALGFVAALLGTVYLALTSPSPTWGTLGEYTIVEGPTHVSSYAHAWYVWLALLLYAGVVEFALRGGHGIGADRLRNLPSMPLSRRALRWTVAGVAGFVALATTRLVIRAGIAPTWSALIVFVLTLPAAAVPLAALLRDGALLPMALFAAYVPYALILEVFVTTDSPLHILLFGPYAIVLAVAWGVETALRDRISGRNGGRFGVGSFE